MEVVRLGRDLVSKLFVLFKTSLNYPEGHAALEAPANNLAGVLRQLQDRGEETTLRLRGGHLYLGELRLRLDLSGFEAARFVMEELENHKVGGISFSEEVTPAELCRFMYAIREVEDSVPQDRYGKLLERMQHRVVAGIAVEAWHEEPQLAGLPGKKQADPWQQAKHLHDKAILETKELLSRAAAGHPLRIKGVKRFVQRMIDLICDNEPPLLALSTMQCGSARDSHPVDVCILSLAIGRRMGFSKFHLLELGMAAVLHDIGSSALPPEQVGMPENVTDQERRMLEGQAIAGVERIMQSVTVDATVMRIISCIFEHELSDDFSAYLQAPYRRKSLLARIVGTANRFHRLLVAQRKGPSQLPPDLAVRQLLKEAEGPCERALAKLLCDAVGLHSIGTVLLLDSGELAVLVENHPDRSRSDAPVVKLIADRDGHEIDGETVDLAASGNCTTIMGAFDPGRYGLEVGRYLRLEPVRYR